ncbi:hypothetical protein E3P94_01329 [Wallemia ichthyophaga]|uniref:Mitochondrial import receptor subunit tom20 n=1 Tax=Wallemia ichthyophaga TaxID=245174 RepID=A0A4T0GIS4_WALIC|nr:hypothetical protein E3P95_01197 [Wallemia ichthyophaga]TIB02791.1 hypothetical protein E3P94_01329 [Wallemia ichthyophaga]TIB38810.1 hypothetical protein E3P86_01440 [Wallemia ichthyophaga]
MRFYTVAAATALVGFTSYAVYFDYKRRNDTAFRKSLKKAAVKQGKADKAAAEKGAMEMQVALKAAVLEANIEVEAFKRSVTGAEQGEAYFMQNVGNGEVLASMGPESALKAATAFFKALKVYPSPVELLMIYERTVPPPIFQLVMQMTSQEVANAQSQKAPEQPKSGSIEEDVTEDSQKPSTEAPTGIPASAPSDTSSHEWENIQS